MRKLQLLMLAMAIAISANAQEEKTSSIEFTPVIDIKTSPVKSQDRTGTCWSYSTTSFLETEVIRQGGPVLDLSEMYFVRYAYPEKARLYIMAHGKGNFSEGGQAHDVMNVVREFGMATEEAYPGRRDVSQPHNHSELASTQKVVIDNYIKGRNASPAPVWYEVQSAILDLYLGEVPAEVDGKTPQQFTKEMKIVADDYVELTSYTHHPYYQAINLEVPDNWNDGLYYNLPLDELMQVMDNALENGYSFVWDGDVSEKFFSHKLGAAIVPVDEELGFAPQEEQKITPEVRQEAFLSWQSTDDHLMHITGTSTDQNGTTYYKTKNSWGTDRGAYEGYLYMSESYMRLHSVAILIHKDALPKATKKQLGIK
ncbi:C1 family peptidase [Carboxylicivirga sp. M1479]|uniref:C1 family peptidase n=1 Tax=Carboxylicivirga sp. M1479 TaxID=2594476 RepID=UPI0011784CE2|nr:C1 family peptidase [Carboxylicivirga sp. M1479]TRX72511.1 aminopeptidase [Carboxylicivirga sp. M1479]